jgi:hypothetical protein
VGAAAAALSDAGLRIRRHQPTLTRDFVTACLVYGTVTGHPRESKRARSNEDLTGYCFAVRADGWIAAPCPTSCIWLVPDALEVRGGVTKWIGGYLTLYAVDQIAGRHVLETHFRDGTLRRLARWRAERQEHLTLDVSQILHRLEVTPPLRTWLEEMERDARGTGEPVLEICQELRELANLVGPSLVLSCYHARVARLIRRLLLSVLAERGVKVLTTDVDPPQSIGHPRLWVGDQLRSEMHGLEISVGRRAGCEPLSEALGLCRMLLTNAVVSRQDIAVTLQRVECLTIRSCLP